MSTYRLPGEVIGAAARCGIYIVGTQTEWMFFNRRTGASLLTWNPATGQFWGLRQGKTKPRNWQQALKMASDTSPELRERAERPSLENTPAPTPQPEDCPTDATILHPQDSTRECCDTHEDNCLCDDETQTITRELIFAGRSDPGSWTKAQLALLGVEWPPAYGWIDRIVGNSITKKDAQTFLALRGQTIRKLRRQGGQTNSLFDGLAS